MTDFYTIKWLETGLVSMIDQRKLPHEVVYNNYQTPTEVADAIQNMVIRGAPAIGAAAAFGLVLIPWYDSSDNLKAVKKSLEDAAEVLAASRPTAVNLFWALNRMMDLVKVEGYSTVDELRDLLLNEAQLIAAEDAQINLAIC